MSQIYKTTFDVSGGGAFPLDMLRYDCCFPSHSNDTTAIEDSLAVGDGTLRKIRLIKYHGGKSHNLTPGRWESFGWKIDQTPSTEKLP